MQTAKVVRVRENSKKGYLGKNGQIFIHLITVENSDIEWEYHSQKDTCTKFVAGQEATFTTEVKTNGNFVNNKISPVTVPTGNPNAGGYGAKPTYKAEPKDQGAIQAMSCVSSAVNHYQNRKDGSEEAVLAFAEKIHQWVSTKSTK